MASVRAFVLAGSLASPALAGDVARYHCPFDPPSGTGWGAAQQMDGSIFGDVAPSGRLGDGTSFTVDWAAHEFVGAGPFGLHLATGGRANPLTDFPNREIAGTSTEWFGAGFDGSRDFVWIKLRRAEPPADARPTLIFVHYGGRTIAADPNRSAPILGRGFLICEES